jgi:hypothetical protein
MRRRCPLDPAWRTWSAGEHLRLPAAVRARLVPNAEVPVGACLATFDLDWRVAADDATRIGTPATPQFLPGYPRHSHADLVVAGVALHVDHVCAGAGAPGRFYADYRVHRDGALVGRGGVIGCSLGGGGSDLPVRVPLGTLVLVVDEDGRAALHRRGRARRPAR